MREAVEVSEVKTFVISQKDTAAALDSIRAWYRQQKEIERKENGIMKRDKVGTAICIGLQAVLMAAGFSAVQEKSGDISFSLAHDQHSSGLINTILPLCKEVSE